MPQPRLGFYLLRLIKTPFAIKTGKGLKYLLAIN